MPLITMSNTSRSIGIRSADNPADRPPTRQERDLPTTAADDYLTPIERRHGAALIKRLRQRQRERLLTELDPESRLQRESLQKGIVKARRLYNSGRLMSFRRFCSVMKDLLDEWDT